MTQLPTSGFTIRGATSSSFRGGQWQVLWNFIRWSHRAYSTVVQLFRKRPQIKFSSQHFRKRELLSFDFIRSVGCWAVFNSAPPSLTQTSSYVTEISVTIKRCTACCTPPTKVLVTNLRSQSLRLSNLVALRDKQGSYGVVKTNGKKFGRFPAWKSPEKYFFCAVSMEKEIIFRTWLDLLTCIPIKFYSDVFDVVDKFDQLL